MNLKNMKVGTACARLRPRPRPARRHRRLRPVEDAADPGEQLRKAEAGYTDAQARLVKTFQDPSTTADEHALVSKLQEEEAAARPLMQQAEQLGLANKAQETNDLMMNKVAPLQTAWLGTMKALARWEVKANESAAHDARQAYDAAVRFMLTLAGSRSASASARPCRSRVR